MSRRAFRSCLNGPRAPALAGGCLWALAVIACAPDGAQPAPPPARAAATPAREGLLQAPFQGRRERALPAKPEGLWSGDLDGDGQRDLVASLVTPGAVVAWRGSAGGLAREAWRAECGDFPLRPEGLPAGSFGASADRPRIAVASRAERSVSVIQPFAASPARKLVLQSTPRALATGRIGGRAVIAAACDDRRLELWFDGADAPVVQALDDDLPRCARVVDSLGAVIVGFQGSAALEAIAAADGRRLWRIELGGIPRHLAELDVDGDGDAELAVASGDRDLWILGAGVTGGPAAWPDEAARQRHSVDAIPLELCVDDFDRDGRDDLALLAHYDLRVRLLTRWSAQGPAAQAVLPAGQTPVAIAAVDFDGDGAWDVAVANRDTLGIGALAGDGKGGWNAARSLGLGDFPNVLAASPSAQSALRLVAINAKSNSLSAIVLRDGALRVLPAVSTPSEARGLRLAEFDDRAGVDALLFANTQGRSVLCLYSGDVDGTLREGPRLEFGTQSDLELLDVDDAGAVSASTALEIAWCDPALGQVGLLERALLLGDREAAARSATLDLPSAPRALERIELDGDPAPELACLLGAPGARVGVAWVDARRRADGKLELAELGFVALEGAPIHARAADLDGDGRTDLAVLCLRAPDATEGEWRALLRTKDGGWSVQRAQPTGHRPHRLCAADLDGDGRAEVFVAAQNSHLINGWTCLGLAGDGTLEVRAFDDLGAGLGPLDLALTDVDGDGIRDLCVANGFSNDLSVLQGRASSKASSTRDGR